MTKTMSVPFIRVFVKHTVHFCCVLTHERHRRLRPKETLGHGRWVELRKKIFTHTYIHTHRKVELGHNENLLLIVRTDC